MVEDVDEGAAGGLLEEARREVAQQRWFELNRHLAGSPGWLPMSVAAQPPAKRRRVTFGDTETRTYAPARSSTDPRRPRAEGLFAEKVIK